MSDRDKRIDAVFEGGGVKGIALAGAVAEALRRGYVFENVAGTSAGAIMAALVAAGHGAEEIERILKGMDFEAFCDKSPLDRIPLLGPAMSLAFENGIFEGAYFERWMRELLEAKGVRRFGDLVIPEHADDPRFRYRLQVIATDLTRGELLVLPGDARKLGVDPDELDVAEAVRMSMSIPYFFEPVVRTDARGVDHCVVDGGVLSNFPVWLLDDETANPPWPTIGFKLVDPQEGQPARIRGPISMLAALVSTMLEARDRLYLAERDFTRTVPIPTLGVRTTDFDLTDERKDELLRSGADAAAEFFDTWDFASWTRSYRQGRQVGRRARLRAARQADPDTNTDSETET